MSPVSMSSKSQAIVDGLGLVRDQIAALQEREADLKATLSRFGVGDYHGHVYDANVSVSERGTLDMSAVREKLSPQFIRSHTNYKTVTTVKCTIKKPVLFHNHAYRAA